MNCATDIRHCHTVPAVAAVVYPSRLILVNILVVATFRAVPVKPVTVGAVNPRTHGTVVAFQGGHQYHTLFRARSGWRAESSPLGQIKAGISLFAICRENSFIVQASAGVGELFSGSTIDPLSVTDTELDWTSFPVVQSNSAIALSVELAGHTTSHDTPPPVEAIVSCLVAPLPEGVIVIFVPATNSASVCDLVAELKSDIVDESCVPV